MTLNKPFKSSLHTLQKNSYLFSGNRSYLEWLYEKYLVSPKLLSSEWKDYFAQLDAGDTVACTDIASDFSEKESVEVPSTERKEAHREENIDWKLLTVIKAYRRYGHYQAQLDPLNLLKKREIRDLKIEDHGITFKDLSKTIQLEGTLQLERTTVAGLIEKLKKIYCQTIGFEYQHIVNRSQRDWLQLRIESVNGKPSISPLLKKAILKDLIRADALEKFLGNRFVAQKRFSIEGADSLIPALNHLINEASLKKIQEIVIGMAHRGRLNVLINVFGKEPAQLFEEFSGKSIPENRSGDVKYHKGFTSYLKTATGVVHIAMAFNPSHLEIIGPVVEGSVRSRQERRQDKNREEVLPVLIHGDAAFSGQGVVMENFELSETKAYGTGGTLHIVLNNQIGFTTNPQEARSSWYCTDVAKITDVPVFHVNSDDPEAVLFVFQLALDFRQTFKKDAVIDLVCYRRHGHNEADEPTATQPLLYKKIRKIFPVHRSYADSLIAQGVISKEQYQQWEETCKTHLEKGEMVVNRLPHYEDSYRIDWQPYLYQDWRAPVSTHVDGKLLKWLSMRLEDLPSGFVVQPQVAKILADRRNMTAGKMALNWGYAEILAYATLLHEGYGLRLSGQDTQRGTFFHRHAVLHDFDTNQLFLPLAQFAKNPFAFTIADSILSEAAVMAFEYGYALSNPRCLVIWEAQYGDFVNAAQVVIDQFLSSSEQKWGRLCGLVLYLPHGYEGSGPEHTSARLERFLQLCAQENMQVCVPSTPAQIFHLLRRQMLRPYRKPLIIMTPKSLLRHRQAVSTLQELTNGKWLSIIPETEVEVKKVKRVVLCSGKIYYDLFDYRKSIQQEETALIRIEQLYPFPDNELRAELARYSAVNDIIWCQEEPKNQGAWFRCQQELTACLTKTQQLRYLGRPESAAPAVGSLFTHTQEQQALVKEVFS